MSLNNSKKKSKNKILNFFIKNGDKKNCENILLKTLKLIQKSNKQKHTELIKLAILNVTPIFRVIKLKKSKTKRRVNTIKELPAFLSDNNFRTSFSLKLLINKTKTKKSSYFGDQLKSEILLNTVANGDVVKLKHGLQDQAIEKKKFFKHYRW